MANFSKRWSGWFAAGAEDQIERQDLCAGAVFARQTETQLTETVCVLGITEDEGGIPHVRYDSRLHKADRTLELGQRTLALPSFLRRFDKLPTQGLAAQA